MKGIGIVEKEMREMKENILEYRQGVSRSSKERERLLHILESEKLDAIALMQIVKGLKKAQQERRVWKTLLYEAEQEYFALGGDKQLKALEKARMNKVKRYTSRKSWFDNFSEEAMAILNGNAGGLANVQG